MDPHRELAEWLHARQLSVRAAGAELGCSGNMVHMIMRRDRLPGRDLAVRIWRAAGIPVEAWGVASSDG